MTKNRHILHAAARKRGDSSRATVLIAALAVLAGATAAVQPAQAQTVDICERTTAVRTIILAAGTETNCAAVPTDQLRDITELNLQRRSISALKAGDFANLSRLEVLNLDFNNLESLPPGLFDDLPALEFLNLNFNNLESPESLPANVFEGLSNLQTLFLGVNGLTSVPANVFDDLSSITRLNLGTNELDSLPPGLFDDLSALDNLTLDRNNLQSLDENLFGRLSNLTFLDLSHNSLESLSAGLFDGLFTLRELILDNNSLTSLPAGLFNDALGTLTNLRLDNNLRAAVSIGPSAAVITPNSVYSLTAQLTAPSPAPVRLIITAGGAGTSRVTLPDPATVTIPAGMVSANFDITLTGATVGNAGTISLRTPALLYTDTNDDVRENTDSSVISNLVSGLNTEDNTFAFTVAAQPGATVSICDRTPGVETAILAATRVIEANCAVVPQASLNTVNELNLRSASLTILQSGDFANLPNLQRLFLDSNNLTSLPAGLFDDVLDTLTELTLDDALKAEVSIEPRTVTIITLNAIQTFTAQLTPPLPATMRLDITASGDEAENVTFPDPATVTIPAGMTSATFDITLTGATAGNTGIIILSAPALIYTDTNGDEQRNTTVVNSLVNASTATSSTFTVAETPLVATLTRNSPSTEEGASPTPGIFTLALSNAPDGLSTVTYTLAVSGDNADPADISVEFGGDAVRIPNTSDVSGTFTMTVTDGDASATLAITPEDDADATDEVVTLTIISIEFAGSSIGPDDIQGTDVSNGALAITISDDDPTATYDLEDSTASEPTSSTATDATTATFTITLSRLNTTQTNSLNRRFFFRVAPDGIGDGTPGYGSSLPMSIDSNSLASSNDFNLEYQSEDGLSVVEFIFDRDSTAQGTFSSDAPIPKAAGGTEEVYRFHIIPTHDDDKEGAERVLFGYRVHFPGQDSHGLTGVVNGSTTAPAATIREDAAIRLRIRTFLEGALQ